MFPVCPEVLGGLPTPRRPAEIVNGVVINNKGVSVDKEFRAGAEKALVVAKENKVELAILQSRSLKLSITLDTLTARILKLSSDSQSGIEPTPF